MELSLGDLLSSHILQPAKNSAEVPQHANVRSIVVAEAEASFLDRCPQSSLVFFPRGTDASLSLEHLALLGRTRCAAVLYESHPLLASPPKRFPLPVFTLCDTCSISDAVESCYRLAFGGVQKLAELSLEAISKLSNELLNHRNESPNIIKVAAELMECPVAFTTPDFHLRHNKTVPQHHVVNPLYAEDSFNWELALHSFQASPEYYKPKLATGLSDFGISGYLHQNPYCKEQGHHIFAFPMEHGDHCYGYVFLSLTENMKMLSPEKGIKMQQILSMLKLEVIKSDKIAQTVNRYYDFLLDELLESDQTDFRKLMQKYGLVQKVIADKYCILLAGRRPRSEQGAFYELLTSQQFNILYDRLVDVLGATSFFLFERKDCLAVFLPQYLLPKTDMLKSVIDVFQEFLKEQYQGIGISDIVDTENVRQGYFQALKSLAISKQRPRNVPCHYSELGVLRFFFDRSNQLDISPLTALYREYIFPILQYDQSHGSELFPTLTTYMFCCSSPSAACSELYIHKNTLYSRLNKISALLKKNLSDSETVFNLLFGIKIHALIQAGVLPQDFAL